ncbi:acyclic terpene utilization AtuA family protein, partial [Streptococcus suis]
MTALGDFVTIVGPAGVIGGIVSGSVNHVLKSWGERRTTQAQARYLALRVAIVTGDDLLPRAAEFADTREMFSGAAMPAKLWSMNAYLGA